MNKKSKPKWWNNGWIGLAVLLVAYAVLFIIGKNSITLEPDPVFSDQPLSTWTGYLSDHDSIFFDDHNKAVDVLRKNQKELTPVLIQWLDARDSFPQLVYFSTMARFGGSDDRFRYLKDDKGAHSKHIRAVKAFRSLHARDPDVSAALQRNLEYYRTQNAFKKGKGGDLAALTEETLNRIKND